MSEKINVAWFSCGVTSAVACKHALNMYPNVRIMYIDTGSAHLDNKRFIKECEEWYGKEIEIFKNKKYNDVIDVVRKTKYINGPTGARCTLELKKNVRREIEKEYDVHHQIFGFEFTKKEINRAIRFSEQHPHTNPKFPLIELKINKNKASGILMSAGIDMPTMYKMGYNNNNCIGCVKGQAGYWNKIRNDFPDIFNEMSLIEREIGHSCCKISGEVTFLDELEPNRGRYNSEVFPECDTFCAVDFADLIDPNTDNIFNGDISISDII